MDNDLKFDDKQLIIFDLDGTLVDSAPDLANAINKMLEVLGRSQFPTQQIRSWVGNGAQVLVERALSGSSTVCCNLDRELASHALTTFLTIYRENVCIDSVLYPNVLETLNTLKQRDYRLAIVTNKPFEFVEPILLKLGLTGLFEAILGGDSLSAKKPDPMPLNHLVNTLSVAAKHCLMVGDSKNDIVAAKNADMQSIGLTYGYNYGEDISVYQPDYVTGDFAKLTRCLALKNN